MSESNRLDGYGKVCLSSALVVQLSWIPALGLLEGASWSSPHLAGTIHFGALTFMIAAPLAFGARLWLSTPKAEVSAVMKDWGLRCFLPPALFAAAIQGVVRFAPHVTIPLVIALMIATMPLGIYGVLLHRDASAARE
jgi:hypothetical protein